ncbi:hypothetical protein B0J11DRAFT_547388 [Dendryphion nanum]|uniref:Uncharacterized protein n=1 Tax=Dendryphion nanum TaxID=256645 RepID=A0A9P9IVU6_9PLEO|nr:hypothetical protein B0J11DRAFT_547388 [Dendryphion nanum]
MGGLAFAKSGPNGSPLNIPRMPPSIYESQATKITSKLATVFRNITIPREAPGKLDYGDIDFLVEGPLVPWTPESLKQTIGAVKHINHGGTHTYAVPYPDAEDQFVQVDVEICPGNGTPDSKELFEWTRFMKSDADLLQIIGVCHRPLGLTCNDKGLHLSVLEVQSYNKKKALIFLTRSPREAIEFYGFDYDKYVTGFASESEVFDWVSAGRFFARAIFDRREEKANDRARQRKRPMYSRFVEEYVPSHPEAGTGEKLWTREEVRDTALETFGKRAKYDELMAEHEIRERDNAIWQRVKEVLPVEGNSLAMTMKGLRRWVRFANGEPFIAQTAILADSPVWAKEMGDEEQTLAWVALNWKEAKSLEKARSVAAKEAGKNNTTVVS